MDSLVSSTQPACFIATARISRRDDLPVHRLSNDVIQKASEAKAERRQQYLTGRILLAELLFKTHDVAELPTIITNNNGRPSFSDPALPDFNISHSGDYIMVALAKNCCVGLDLELLRPRKRLLDLAKYSFSEIEYLWITEQSESQREPAFWQLWTLRESILKLAGKGVWQMKKMRISPHDRQLSAEFADRLYCWSSQQDELFWSIATDRAVAKSAIALWRASDDLRQLLSQPQPELTLFSSD